jgi:hypothetical protein
VNVVVGQRLKHAHLDCAEAPASGKNECNRHRGRSLARGGR